MSSLNDYIIIIQEEENIDELKKYCHSIKTFKMSIFDSGLKAIVNYLFKRWPLQVGYFYSKDMQQWINKNAKNYKKVFCNHLRCSSYVLNCNSIEKYIDCVDAITLNYENKVKSCKGINKVIYNLELSKVRKYEKRIYESFNKLFIISERDKNYIMSMGINNKPYVLYNYVRDLGFKKELGKKDKKSICFIGKMSTEPNVNAMIYFVNNIYKEVKKVFPDLQLDIIGGNPSKKIKELSQIGGINILGFVDDIAAIIQKETLVIAPMVSGSGLQNKIIECMNLEKLVLTTKIGADGLANISGNELVIAENTQDYINKLIYYLSDNNYDKVIRIEKSAREYVQKEYSYEKVRSQMLDFM